MKKKYYVYQHLYNNKVIYIGKGTVEYKKSKSKGGYDYRAFELTNRNVKYVNFLKKVSRENIEVRIVARFDCEKDALWLEEELHMVYDGLFSRVNNGNSHPNYGKTGEKSQNTKKVICLTTKKIFNCIKDASDKYGIDGSCIVKQCKGKRKSAGKHPITGEKMLWSYCENIS